MGTLDDTGAVHADAGAPATTTATALATAPVETTLAPAPAATTLANAPAETTPAKAHGPGTPALLEVIDRDGHVRQVWPIHAWPATVGRALDNDIVLTDPHVAAHHFSIERDGEGLGLHAGHTVNGVVLDGHRLASGAAAALPRDHEAIELIVGRTRLRLRLADAALAPELPLATSAVTPLRLRSTLVLAALLFAGLAFNTYLDADPDTFVRVLGNTLLAALGATAIWAGAWALLSKTITRQGHFGWHLRVFVVAGLAMLALALVPPLLAFSLSWPWLTDFSFAAAYAVGAAALYFHLLAVEPARPRLLRWVVATAAVVGVALTLWFNLQRSSRIGEELYMSHLFPPALRLAPLRPTDRFIENLAPLQALLDKKAKEPAGADGAGAPDNRSDDDE